MSRLVVGGAGVSGHTAAACIASAGANPVPDDPRLDQSPYATRPTRFTIFLRTFLPWQIWRFVRINMRMVRAISKSHH